jgi:hypothetical protein
MKNQRDVQGTLINEVTMIGFAMVAQTLAVVRNKDDERPIPPAAFLQRLLKPAHQLIHLRKLRIVGRRAIRLVHIEKMHKHENRLSAMRIEPLIRRAKHQSSGPPFAHRIGSEAFPAEQHGSGKLREGPEIEGAVVSIEAFIEPQLPFQKDAADESGGLITAIAQYGRKCHCAGRDTPGIFFDSVREGIGGREQGSVRGKRERDVRLGGGE